MFKKITTLFIIGGFYLSSGVFGYTDSDVQNANYFASRNIIRDWSVNPTMYKLDSYPSRAAVIAILVTMKWDVINETCRGDFIDVGNFTTNDKWTCRILETAADRGYINAMGTLPMNMRKVRPNDHTTHSEAIGILMKASNESGTSTEYNYFWDANFPNNGDSIGYKDAYYFGASWQAVTMYSYIRNILKNDLALRSDPLVNRDAQLKEVLQFAREIYS